MTAGKWRWVVIFAVAVFVGIVNLLGVDTVRNVFIAVKPGLMSLLTFGHAGVVGSVLRIAAEVALGAVGGVIGAAGALALGRTR